VLSRYTNGHVTIAEVLSLLWQPRAQFWFLYVLFFVFVFAILIYRHVNTVWIIGVLVASLCLYFFADYIHAGYLGSMVSRYFIYFALGVWFSTWNRDFNFGSAYWLTLIGLLFIAVQLFYQFMPVGQSSLYISVISLTLAVAGIVLVLVLSQFLVLFNLEWLAIVGRYSMVIFLVHILVGSGCRVILQKGLGITDVPVHMLVGMTGALFVPIIFYQLCRKMNFVGVFSLRSKQVV
jgi:peptidoglycan/LPS O-acetylase OafA/YrhL